MGSFGEEEFIFHFPFVICHLSFPDRQAIAMANGQMTNGKMEMKDGK